MNKGHGKVGHGETRRPTGPAVEGNSVMKGEEISAYVPVFNNAATLGATIASLRRQTRPPAEILVIDDGSTDGSGEVAERAGATVFRSVENQGRGAARARGMAVARHEWVLCCDGTNTLAPDFAARALAHFRADERLAAVFGRITQGAATGPVGRWRGRHLFKDAVRGGPVVLGKTFSTYGAMVSRSKVAEAGGYDPALRHNEDADLGARLRGAKLKVVMDPALVVVAGKENTMGEVLERFWRWHTGKDERFGGRDYAKMIWYSMRTMAGMDLRAGDPGALLISLVLPHYMAWRARRARGVRRGQTP